MTSCTFLCLVALVGVVALASAQDSCGGCTGSPTAERICRDTGTDSSTATTGTPETKMVTRTLEVTETYTCYTRRKYYFWVFFLRKRCYRKVYRKVTEMIQADGSAASEVGTQVQLCCEGYTRNTADMCIRCGRNKYPASTGVSKFIVGGVTALPNQYPWLVRLASYMHNSQRLSFCGGTIIGKRWILTAAHCVHGSDTGSFYSYATVGDHDRRSSGTGANEKRYRYKALHVHPDYARIYGTVSNYDVALVETTEDMQYNEDVQPACLPSSRASYTGKTVAVAGWGILDGSSSTLPINLQHTEATVIDPYICNSNIYKNIICAQGTNNNVCMGDSGGPMVYRANGYSTVIGVSWWSVRGCPKGYQFGYTDVGAYRTWIDSVMFG